MSTPPVDPSVAAGGGTRPDATDPAGRLPPSRSDDPGRGSYGGFRGQEPSAQPQPKGRDDDEHARAMVEARVAEVLGVTSTDNRLAIRPD